MKKTVSLVLVLAMIAVVWTGFGSAASASEAQVMNNTEKALALISTFHLSPISVRVVSTGHAGSAAFISLIGKTFF